MHWLLKLAMAFNAILTVLIGGLVSLTIEELFPRGANGEFTIFSTSSDSAELTTLAAAGEISLAKVTYTAEGGGTTRVISIPTGSPPTELTAETDYPEYGVNTSTIVRLQKPEEISPLGRWVFYGDQANFEIFATKAEALGYTIAQRSYLDIWGIAHYFYATNLWPLQGCGIAFLFVAALVSTQALTRARVIQLTHGQGQARVLFSEFSNYILYASLTFAAAWALWTLITVLFLGGGQVFGAPGLIFGWSLLITLVFGVAACGLAILINSLASSRLVEQIKGSKPIALTRWSAAFSIFITLIAAYMGAGYLQSTLDALKSAQARASAVDPAPNGFTISFWGIGEDSVQKILPDWKQFITEADQQDRVTLLALEQYCTFVTTERPCYTVNPKGAQELGLTDAESLLNPTIIAPESAEHESGIMIASLAERIDFESELDDDARISPNDSSIPAAESLEIDFRTYQTGARFPIYTRMSGAKQSTSLASVTDPVIIVLPLSRISANTHYSWTSQGFELFNYDSPHELLDPLTEHGMRDYVAWVERPSDALATQVAQLQADSARFLLIEFVTILSTCTLSVLFTLAYYQQQRRVIFIKRVHGATWFNLYGEYSTTIITFGVLAMLANPAANTQAWLWRGLIALTALASGLLVLQQRISNSHVSESKFA